ncbi:MAG: metallophosphoesterase, partial [Helicobacter sp.]|nr:metallophosphoesterase [Helicobacter sp.]
LLYQPFLLISHFSGKRRGLLKGIVNYGSGIFAGGYLSWSLIEGRIEPKVEVVDLELEGLPSSFNALQISDLHLGGLMDRNALKKVIRQANALKADAVFLTGDIIDSKLSEVADFLDEFLELQAPLGVYFVLGNHEYLYDIGALLDAIRAVGIIVLENENILLKRGNQGLVNLVGVYDLFGRRIGVLEPDLPKALKGIQSSLPTILLAHQPKFVLEVEEKDKIDLVMSGHTHGGQIFPFGLLVMLDQPYLHGLYQHSPTTKIYVNRGTAFWGPPMRVLARAEITYYKFSPKQEIVL